VQPHFKSARQRRPTAFAGASLVEDDEVDEQGELDADESQAGDHHHHQQQQQQQQQRSAEVVQDPHARRTSESIADVHIKVAELNAKVNMGEPVEEIELVRAMCLAHKLFEQMSPVQAEQLLERLQPQQLQKEEILFSAGDTGSDMFVVCSGVLACINKDGNTVKLLGRGVYRVWGSTERWGIGNAVTLTFERLAFRREELNAGEIFGELAALGLNTERTLTMRAQYNCMLYRLGGSDLRAVLADHPQVSPNVCIRVAAVCTIPDDWQGM
jgi:CRP-like cAMP-binding protein